MKTCVITGTGSGIGREVAILLSHAKEYEHIERYIGLGY